MDFFDTASQSLSPAAASHHPNLRLPATCDPPSESNPPKQASWIVFGATGHMGRSLVRAVLSHGDKCTAVGWTQENDLKQMQMWQDNNCLGLLCDVRVRETVDTVIKRSIAHWGNVDIIANCTGYGVLGSCEDQDDYDLRNQFTTNFLGTLHIIQLSLPHFRAQSNGRYLIFSSTAGALGVPGLGPYCASKYAVEGLIESMLYEIDVFNIKATLVEPGHVRLDEPDDYVVPSASANYNNLRRAGAGGGGTGAGGAGGGMGGGMGMGMGIGMGMGMPMPMPMPMGMGMGMGNASTAATTPSGPPPPKRYGHFWVKPNPSAPYKPLNSPARHAKRMVQWLNDRQPVSAVKSAELVWQLGHCSYPPLRLLLGSYAVDSIRDRLKSIIEEIEDWKYLSFPVTLSAEEEEREDERAALRAEQELDLEDEEMLENE